MPAAQDWHAAEAVWPVPVRKVPAQQLEQTLVPVPVWYCPAEQFWQAVRPATPANEPAAQKRQAADVPAAVAVPYLPVEHSVHAMLDGACGDVEKEPAAHAKHWFTVTIPRPVS